MSKYRFWWGTAAGAVVGCLLTLGGVALAHRNAGGDPLGPAGNLYIASGVDESPGQERATLLDVWNADHPDHQAFIKQIAQTTNGQHSDMRNRTDVDVYNLDATWTPEFVEANLLRPLESQQFPDGFSGFLPKPLSTGQYRNKQWALPFNSDVGLIFYRLDLLGSSVPAKDGLPQLDWPAIEKISQQVPSLKNTNKKLVAGYTSQLRNFEGLTVNGLEALAAANVKLFTQVSTQDPQQAGTVDFRPREWSDALRPLTVAAHDVLLASAWKDVETDNRAEFRDGQVLLMRNWPITYAILTTSDPSARPPVAPGIALVPGGHGVLGGQNLAIARTSAHPAAAQALIQFLTSEQMQKRLAKFGGFAPTRQAAYDGWPVPYAKTLLRAVNDAYVRPVTPYYSMFSSVFRDGICYAKEHDGELPPALGAALNQALAGRQAPLTSSCRDN